MRRLAGAAVWALVCLASPLLGQSGTTSRAVATLTSVLANPVFYHGKTVSLLASPVDTDGLTRIATASPSQTVIITWKNGRPPAGHVEVRGLFFDVGRFTPDDTRLPAYGIPALVRALKGDAWPARETFFVFVNATWAAAPDANDTGMRAVTLEPDRFEGKTVTLRGRFRGQNLYGDEPVWPRQSQWDFVLQSADADIWATGLRPKGKDFDFDPRSRRNTDSFLEVTGIIKVVQGLPYLVTATVKPAPAVIEPPPAAEPVPTLAPPEIVFTAPANDEPDVDPTNIVRLQFSRDMSAASFDGHIQVAYGTAATGAPPKFTVTYKPGNLAAEIKFEAPLARFSTVTIELGPGITAKDGTPLAASKLTFTIGGGF